VESAQLSSEILRRVVSIEHALTVGFNLVEEELAARQDVFEFFSEGLKAYKQSLFSDAGISESKKVLGRWLENIRVDQDLRFPHRKILDFLLGQYDFTTNEFKEAHFSRIVKEARVGKNMANGYLTFLEQKGYIQKREDGYRKFYKIRGEQKSGAQRAAQRKCQSDHRRIGFNPQRNIYISASDLHPERGGSR